MLFNEFNSSASFFFIVCYHETSKMSAQSFNKQIYDFSESKIINS